MTAPGHQSLDSALRRGDAGGPLVVIGDSILDVDLTGRPAGLPR